MRIEEANAIARAEIRIESAKVMGKISGEDAEAINRIICDLAHRVIPGRNDRAGHNARIKVKDIIGKNVEQEIMAIRAGH